MSMSLLDEIKLCERTGEPIALKVRKTPPQADMRETQAEWLSASTSSEGRMMVTASWLIGMVSQEVATLRSSTIKL